MVWILHGTTFSAPSIFTGVALSRPLPAAGAPYLEETSRCLFAHAGGSVAAISVLWYHGLGNLIRTGLTIAWLLWALKGQETAFIAVCMAAAHDF